LGVVFLLFMIGLELSFNRLKTMQRLVFGFGTLQVLFSAAAICGVALLLGQELPASVVLGLCLSLSSTAIVLELLSRQGRLSTSVGRSSFAVLLAQDLAVIPLLMFISIAGTRGSVLASLFTAVVQAVAAVAMIVLLGRFLMRPLFRIVAAARTGELFIAAVVFVIIGAAVIANQAGLSMALGAFVAGLLLAETEYAKAIQATVEPFKGLLLGIFFFTVGMNIDFRELLSNPAWLLICVFCLIAGKALIVMILGKLFRLSWPTAIETGLLLGPGGEFAFVGIAMAAGIGLVDRGAASFVLAVTSVTMAFTPVLAASGTRIRRSLHIARVTPPELSVRPPGTQHHGIIIGYGRVGKVVCSLFEEHHIPFIVADYDSATVTRDRRAGKEVYFGNAADVEFLKACGLMEAAGVVITINAHDTIDDIVRRVRFMRPDILIVARARDADHARHLYAIGATEAVPETIEASFQLSEAALVGLGVAMGPAIASIHEKRDVFRSELRDAARKAGRGESYSARRRTLRSAKPSPD